MHTIRSVVFLCRIPLCWTLFLALALTGYGQMANDGFDPGANDIVRAFAVDGCYDVIPLPFDEQVL